MLTIHRISFSSVVYHRSSKYALPAHQAHLMKPIKTVHPSVLPSGFEIATPERITDVVQSVGVIQTEIWCPPGIILQELNLNGRDVLPCMDESNYSLLRHDFLLVNASS